jgi:hypothetical protein
MNALIAIAAAAATAAPGSFTPQVDNPWLPLRPGTTYVYRGVKEGEASRNVVTVTGQTRTIQGVRCVVVRDLFYAGGRLVERTSDWYAQDVRGSVWYFGEATAELDAHGKVRSTEGSWQAGVDGAKAGVVMPAQPKVGQVFRQEYYKGHAEDHFRILDLRAKVKTPHVSSQRALLTREWTPLDPGVVDRKYYVRGIGMVRDEAADGSEHSVLVSVTRR